MTKNKVTAITSEKVGMSTDHSNSVSTEADRLNGKNVESPTTKLLCGRRSRSNSMDASRTTRSTNKVGNGCFDRIFNDNGIIRFRIILKMYVFHIHLNKLYSQ